MKRRRRHTLLVQSILCGFSVSCMACATSQSRPIEVQKRLERYAKQRIQDQKRIVALSRRIDELERLNTPVVPDLDDSRRSSTSDALFSAPPGRASVPALPSAPVSAPVSLEAVDQERRGDARSDPGSPPAPPIKDDRSLVSRHDVGYSGDALRVDAQRPRLRLRGKPSQNNEARKERKLASTEQPSVPSIPPHVPQRLDVIPFARHGSPKVKAETALTKKRDHRSPRRSGIVDTYARALGRYRRGDYRHAAAAFRKLLATHAPAGSNAKYSLHHGDELYIDNALYWLAECHYALHNYRAALEIFRRVVDEHPTGNKAGGALLKMGFCYLKLSESKRAQAVLTEVLEIFPNTKVAGLAATTLGKLRGRDG